MKNTGASFRLTEDGRLTSASATVTGQGGAFVSGPVGIATTVVAALASGPISLATALDTTAEAADDAKTHVVEPDEQADDETIEAAYLAEQPAQAEARARATTLAGRLETAYRGVLDDVAGAESDRNASDRAAEGAPTRCRPRGGRDPVGEVGSTL